MNTIRRSVGTLSNALRLYGHYISISMRGQMQYKASFIMLSLGHFANTGIEFLAILILFDRFGQMEGWRLPEVALFYGMVNVAFSLADATARGFDLFANMVKSGDFDRLLLRPRSTVLQLAGQELTLRRVGRLAQGLAVLLWGAHALGLAWTVGKVALLLLTILGAASLFYGIVVVQATTAFWATESLEIFNTITYGGVQTMQYPLTIYRRWFQVIFIYVVPLACVSYFPGMAILGRADPLGTSPLFQTLAPLMGFVFLGASLLLWRVGVRYYRSTGS
jgi:ABC-2 type transport system permease protein